MPKGKKMKFARGKIAFDPVKVSFSSIECGILLSVVITLLLGAENFFMWKPSWILVVKIRNGIFESFEGYVFYK